MTNGTDTLTEKTPTIKLWNPTALNGWSILFSPLFAAWFHAKNWDELGKYKKAKETRMWFYGLIAFDIAFMIFAPDDISLKTAQGVGGWTIIIYYIAMGRKQTLYIKDNNIEYEKKSLAKPLTILSTIYVVIFVLIVLAIYGASEDQVENTYQETTTEQVLNTTHNVEQEHVADTQYYQEQSSSIVDRIMNKKVVDEFTIRYCKEGVRDGLEKNVKMVVEYKRAGDNGMSDAYIDLINRGLVQFKSDCRNAISGEEFTNTVNLYNSVITELKAL